MDAESQSSPKARRILDAARELLLRGGARSVTIADVARVAHVGKGTVYLYWNTKEDLLIELFVRDFLNVLDEVATTLAENPALVVPHEIFPLMQRTLRKHPFLTALRTQDREFLGLIEGHAAIELLVMGAGPAAFLAETLPVLRDAGIVRTDMALEAQILAATAILEGFFSVSCAYPWAMLRETFTGDADTVLGDVFRLTIETGQPIGEAALHGVMTATIANIRKMRSRVAALINNPAQGRSAA